jgi:hypothetical protein
MSRGVLERDYQAIANSVRRQARFITGLRYPRRKTSAPARAMFAVIVPGPPVISGRPIERQTTKADARPRQGSLQDVAVCFGAMQTATQFE